MTSERDLPSGWVLETGRTTHDEFMGREYTTVLYRQEHTRGAVYINEINDGEKSGNALRKQIVGRVELSL